MNHRGREPNWEMKAEEFVWSGINVYYFKLLVFKWKTNWMNSMCKEGSGLYVCATMQLKILQSDVLLLLCTFDFCLHFDVNHHPGMLYAAMKRCKVAFTWISRISWMNFFPWWYVWFLFSLGFAQCHIKINSTFDCRQGASKHYKRPSVVNLYVNWTEQW